MEPSRPAERPLRDRPARASEGDNDAARRSAPHQNGGDYAQTHEDATELSEPRSDAAMAATAEPVSSEEVERGATNTPLRPAESTGARSSTSMHELSATGEMDARSSKRPAKNPRSEQQPGERTDENKVPNDQTRRTNPHGLHAFFSTRALQPVRAVVEHFFLAQAEPNQGAGSPRDDDSQATAMDEITSLHDRAQRLPLTWDLVLWDQLERLRVWYLARKLGVGEDPFRVGKLSDGHAWVVWGLRPRNWNAMHVHEHYPWMNFVTVDHLHEAMRTPPAEAGGVRPYDSTGLMCFVEYWCGIDDPNHLIQLKGSRDPSSSAHAFFISLFWKYRMALHKGHAVSGRDLALSWSSFHERMKTTPREIYDKIEDFYTRTIDGVLVRIHEVSRNHGIGCAVPNREGIVCPMCTGRTPKLPAICRTRFAHLVPLEVAFYVEHLNHLLEVEATTKRRRIDG